MTTKDFKFEMEQLVANATMVEEYTFLREKTQVWKSTVGERVYEWQGVSPEEFAREQMKKFNSQTRQISKVDLSADKHFIDMRQKTLAYLWNSKELWKPLVKLYKKYESKREELLKFNSYLAKYRLSDREYERLKALDTKIKCESKKILGREDLFYLYDTMPGNWLAMA